MPAQELNNALREKGWFISHVGMEACKDAVQNLALNQVILWLMNQDLKDVGDPAFPGNLKKATQLPQNIVLQISKIRNIASPKAYKSDVAPRLLKLNLTDGHASVPALEISHISSLSEDTPPGTKILLRGGRIKVLGGYILLEASGVELLGGVVDNLITKWKMSQDLLKYSRSDGSNGAPPWIPFGQKLQGTGSHDRNFKSLEANKPEKVDSEFEAQRQATIAEATKNQTTSMKVFGGGDKKLADYGTQQLMEAGYPLHQVEKALKLCGYNVDKALNKLQSWEKRSEDSEPYQKSGGGKGGKKGNRKEEQDGEEVHHTRPSGPSTLFDFLQPKLEKSGQTSNTSRSSASTSVTRNFSDMSITDRREKQQWNPRNNREVGRNNRQTTNYSQKAPNRNYGGTYEQTKSDERDKSFQKPPRFRNEPEDSSVPIDLSRPPPPIMRKTNVNVGDRVMARYWEDNRFYQAVVNGVVGPDFMVYFLEYGNTERVLAQDIFPLPQTAEAASYEKPKPFAQDGNFDDEFSGTIEFRRGGGKPMYRKGRPTQETYIPPRQRERP